MADDGYRYCLQQAIAVISSQAGFSSMSSMALETITEMIQSVLCEIGRCSQSFCEISSRTKPTLCDVEQTLINTVGFTVQDVANYYQNAPSMTIHPPEKVYEKSQPKLITVGTPAPSPSYIPDHFPPLPSPHTYIRTPTYKFPNTEYATVRKKRSESVRCSRNSLIKFIVKTSDTLPLVHEDVKESLLIKSNPPVLSYMDALFSSEEDKICQIDDPQGNDSDNVDDDDDDDDDDDSDAESATISKNLFLEPPQKQPDSP